MFVYLLGQTGVDKVLLSNDKLPVVLAVVLIIWIGLALYVFRTDRRISHLEQALKVDDESDKS